MPMMRKGHELGSLRNWGKPSDKWLERVEKIETAVLKPLRLPRGISFKGVYLAKEGETKTTQSPWIEFLPSGFASEAIVYITNDSGDVYSIVLPAVGGRARIERGEL